VDGFKIYDEKLKVLNDEDEEEEEAGKKKIFEMESNGKEDIRKENKVYSFVMTDANYCKRYCTTLLFHVL